MKKSIIFVIGFIMLLSSLYCGENVNLNNNKIVFESISMNVLSDDTIEEMWYKERIPKNFANAFLYNTKGDSRLRLEFYSLMVHESGNFKYYVHKNQNGSYDYGPSQLNSYNIRNKKFMKAFTPKDRTYIETTYCLYMVISINYYRSLRNELGDYALYAYNGGYKAARLKKQNIKSSRYESLLKNVTVYHKRVHNNISKFEKELAEYKKSIRAEHIAKIEKQYRKTFLLRHFVILNDVGFTKNVKHLISNIALYYIKPKDLTEFVDDEFLIVVNSIIGRFYEQVV